MTIRVFDLVGELCMTHEDGEIVHKALLEAFRRGENVELDFDKTRIFVTAFFNASVGQLLEKSTKEELLSRLTFINLPPAAVDALRHSLQNAEEYYHDPAFREALDKILGDLSQSQ
jgi:hypothetical protein